MLHASRLKNQKDFGNFHYMSTSQLLFGAECLSEHQIHKFFNSCSMYMFIKVTWDEKVWWIEQCFIQGGSGDEVFVALPWSTTLLLYSPLEPPYLIALACFLLSSWLLLSTALVPQLQRGTLLASSSRLWCFLSLSVFLHWFPAASICAQNALSSSPCCWMICPPILGPLTKKNIDQE